jgi:hypothetical protein
MFRPNAMSGLEQFCRFHASAETRDHGTKRGKISTMRVSAEEHYRPPMEQNAPLNYKA